MGALSARRWDRLNGHDPVAYILSANVNRRHMTKGQRAMATAMACPQPARLKRASDVDSVNFDKALLSRARMVYNYAPDLTDGVLSGRMELNEAYREAQQRREAAQSDEPKMARLEANAPDLAVMVREERLSLGEAFVALEERRRDAIDVRARSAHPTDQADTTQEQHL